MVCHGKNWRLEMEIQNALKSIRRQESGISIMKVSVVIPTYRRNWELERAVRSLGDQTFRNFEIVIVDDNCDPKWNKQVQQIVEGCRASLREQTIHYICNSSQMGSAAARNIGVGASKGEYITFLDDDDEYLPEKIYNQLTFMENEGLDYSITDLDLYFENGRLSEHRNRSYIKSTDTHMLLTYHLMYHMTGTDTIMMTKAYFERIGGFPPIDVGDEFYLMVRAIEANGKFGYLPVCDVRAYVHVGEGGLSSGEGKIAGQKRIFDFKKQFFHQLDRKSIRYIKMRHFAVLCFAGIRMGNYWIFVKYGFLGFISAPIQCIQMLLKKKKKTETNQVVYN